MSAEQPRRVGAPGSRAAARRAAAPPTSRSGASALPRGRSTVRGGTIAAGAAGQAALRARLRDRLAAAEAEAAATVDSDSAAAAGEPQVGGIVLASEHPTTGVSVAVIDVEPPATDVETIAARVLTALGIRLAGLVRPTDLVVRPWRTRFVLVLDGARDDYQLAAVRRRIADALTPPVLVDGRSLRTSVRVGVVHSDPADTVDALLTRLAASATPDARPARVRRAIGVVTPSG